MNGLERTLAALRGEPADRVPLTAWIFPFSDPAVLEAIRARYGTEAAFFEALDIDFLQAFPEALPQRFGERWGKFSLDEALATVFDDPRDPASPDYRRLTDAIAACRPRGCAVLGNVTGVIEHADAFLGIEDMLLNLAAEPEKMAELFLRLGRWGARSVEACADLGADVIRNNFLTPSQPA